MFKMTLLAAVAVVAMAVGAQTQELDPETEKLLPSMCRIQRPGAFMPKEFCDAERKKLLAPAVALTEAEAQEIESKMPIACSPPQRPSFNDRTPPEAIKAWDEAHKDWMTGDHKVFCDNERKKLEATVYARKAAVVAAEEAKRKAAEARAAEEAAAAKQAFQWQQWASSPDGQRQIAANTLLEAYVHFARVQFCHQLRDGYAVVYISVPEYERSHAAAKAVEKSILAQQPNLNTSAIWQQAVQRIRSGGFNATDITCANERVALYRMSPSSVYQYQKP
jgi:hypothetical protein